MTTSGSKAASLAENAESHRRLLAGRCSALTAARSGLLVNTLVSGTRSPRASARLAVAFLKPSSTGRDMSSLTIAMRCTRSSDVCYIVFCGRPAVKACL
jgi:hypothetical protein